MGIGMGYFKNSVCVLQIFVLETTVEFFLVWCACKIRNTCKLSLERNTGCICTLVNNSLVREKA